MSDTLVLGTPRFILVNGRDPFADETITVDASLTLDTTTTAGRTAVSAAAGVADGTTSTISVAPGSSSEDPNAAPGTDVITISVPVVTAPLVVTLA